MSDLVFVIKKVRRYLADQEEPEELELGTGLNLLIGEPNTGKSVWLDMIDFALGDGGTVENAFGHLDALDREEEELVAKYESIELDVLLGKEDVTIRRNWKEAKTKIFVDGWPHDPSSFSLFVLKQLGLPSLRFPKGDPYSDNTWPNLTWKMLYRHVYRQGRFWNEIADKQPRYESFACLLMILGLAEQTFPQEFEEIIGLRKKLYVVEAQIANYDAMLGEFASKLFGGETLLPFNSSESLKEVAGEVSRQLESADAKRERIIATLANEENLQIDEKLLARVTELESLISNAGAEKGRIIARRERFKRLADNLEAQLEKFGRVVSVSNVLGRFHVSHCPACDRPVQRHGSVDGVCYVCHKPKEEADSEKSHKRLKLEKTRLKHELVELQGLIAELEKDEKSIDSKTGSLRFEYDSLQARLRKVRLPFTRLQSTELRETDIEQGGLQERQRLLGSFLELYDKRHDLSEQLDYLNAEIERIKATGALDAHGTGHAEMASLFSDQMNSYLDKLDRIRPNSWGMRGRIRLHLNKDSFRFTIGERNWRSSVGDTKTGFFLLAYHYAIVALAKKATIPFPPFLIIDLPKVMANISLNEGQEDYLIGPFVELLDGEGRQSQVVFSGRGFTDHEDVICHHMDKVWGAFQE